MQEQLCLKLHAVHHAVGHSPMKGLLHSEMPLSSARVGRGLMTLMLWLEWVLLCYIKIITMPV
jgi:hypothetical protein